MAGSIQASSASLGFGHYQNRTSPGPPSQRATVLEIFPRFDAWPQDLNKPGCKSNGSGAVVGLDKGGLNLDWTDSLQKKAEMETGTI